MAQGSQEWFYDEFNYDASVTHAPTESLPAPMLPMVWEDVGDYGNEADMGPDEAQRAISDFLVAKALDGTYFYCDICVLCWWMVQSGLKHGSILSWPYGRGSNQENTSPTCAEK